GYVGLPLAITFAEAGFNVVGFDVEPGKAAAVNDGKSYIADISDKRLAATGSKLKATSDPQRLREPDAILISVPTPLTKTREPDLSCVISACDFVCQNLRRGQLVIMESTTYPGTTREVILPELEKSGLKAGTDFLLAYSPERVDPGNDTYAVQNTPKLLAGIDAESTRLARLLYDQIVDNVIELSSPEAAELTKIFENVFRTVNIALVNELALLCKKMGLDVWEVIDAAATKPYGFMKFSPGPGVGGHCIPLDPYYLASKAKQYDFHTRFIELAAEINEQMPYHVTSRIMEALNETGRVMKGASILVLGVAYKKDINDTRESPALKLIQLLMENGAIVRYHDPHVPEISIGAKKLTSVELTGERIASADCVVIATDHTSFDYQDIASRSSLLFDTRGVTRGINADNVIRL
ncbi:MAG: nucleotide sugar dehydrogenase, partial [Dehalococcoidales bacterium]|nr:nucleotide sugar dehydrogenase [Dehalococcoidales bacterium]